MSNNKASEDIKAFKEEDNIQILYNKVMKGFASGGVDMAYDISEEGYYHILNAPGYDEIGISEIVAQCK